MMINLMLCHPFAKLAIHWPSSEGEAEPMAEQPVLGAPALDAQLLVWIKCVWEKA